MEGFPRISYVFDKFGSQTQKQRCQAGEAGRSFLATGADRSRIAEASMHRRASIPSAWQHGKEVAGKTKHIEAQGLKVRRLLCQPMKVGK